MLPTKSKACLVTLPDTWKVNKKKNEYVREAAKKVLFLVVRPLRKKELFYNVRKKIPNGH